jgi:hypothetical protein
MLFEQLDGLDHRTASADFIVDEDHIVVGDVADDGEGLRGVRGVTAAAFFDKGHGGLDGSGKVAAFLGKTQVGGDQDRRLHLRQFGKQVIFDKVIGGEHIAGDGEKSLDLAGMQIEGHITIGAGHFDHNTGRAPRR